MPVVTAEARGKLGSPGDIMVLVLVSRAGVVRSKVVTHKSIAGSCLRATYSPRTCWEAVPVALAAAESPVDSRVHLTEHYTCNQRLSLHVQSTWFNLGSTTKPHCCHHHSTDT